MKTMTVNDLREHWPEAEQALAAEHEIIITNEGQPVARLTAIEPESKQTGKRFDPEEQKRFREEVFGKGVMVDWVKEFCEVDRAERF